jgi:outer membrane immunogenic protein
VLTSVALMTLAAAPALAADMPVKAPLKAPPPIFSWTGCYFGGNIGGKWATHSGTVDIAPAGGVGASSFILSEDSSASFVGGVQGGCNYQTGPVVFGLEGDVDWQRWRTTRTVSAPPPFLFVVGDNFDISSRWQASLRGRLGYAVDRVLIYGTAGVAFTNVRVDTNFQAIGAFPAATASDNPTRTGGTVGAGFEYAFPNNWSAGLEGRYSWYGTHTFNAGLLTVQLGPTVIAPVTQSIKLTSAEILFKLNYRFGAPILAQY